MTNTIGTTTSLMTTGTTETVVLKGEITMEPCDGADEVVENNGKEINFGGVLV